MHPRRPHDPGGRSPRAALLTGATSGIGNAFARRLAADGYDLVLVSRDPVRLREVGTALAERHGVNVEVLVADLCDRDALERVADRLRNEDRPVDLLVNNAGFGIGSPFLVADIRGEERMLDILVRAVLVLARAAAPGMVARGAGAIVTVSSVAGFLPGGTYAAAKAWATAFTVSLGGELAGTGVTATALCPGYVRTEFHRRARMDVSRVPDWAWLDADRVVAECLADVRRGRTVSVPSARYKAATAFVRHVPLRFLRSLAARRARLRAAPPDRGPD